MERINKDKRFKKGQITKEVYDVIIYDLESLKDCIKDAKKILIIILTFLKVI